MLFRQDERAPSVDFSRYTDHRTAESSRGNRSRMNVADCVLELNPAIESHQETYKRIMARGRSIEQDHGNVADDQDDQDSNGGGNNARVAQAAGSQANYAPLPGSNNQMQ